MENQPAFNKVRVHWSCRRGMKELDMLIMPFFEEKFDGLAYADQKAFVDLLDFEDPQLFNWLMNKQVPEDQALLRIIRLIQKRNQEYVASTL